MKNNDQFYQLKPVAQPSILGGKATDFDRKTRPGDRPSRESEKTLVKALRAQLRDNERVIQGLETELRSALETIASLQAMLQVGDAVMDRVVEKATEDHSEKCDCGLCSGEYKPQFDIGFGLQLQKGKKPRAYRLSDCKAKDLVPAFLRNIDGVNFEYNPLQGLAITPHYRKDPSVPAV